jgi:hypothetical protein
MTWDVQAGYSHWTASVPIEHEWYYPRCRIRLGERPCPLDLAIGSIPVSLLLEKERPTFFQCGNAVLFDILRLIPRSCHKHGRTSIQLFEIFGVDCEQAFVKEIDEHLTVSLSINSDLTLRHLQERDTEASHPVELFVSPSTQ